jgi:hypothetical protein
MPKSICKICGGTLRWRWEEAFDKFGFGDGDGHVMTHEVVHVLRVAGYDASAAPWGVHNITIYSIKRDGVELIPANADTGYDEPRKYLPQKVVRLLDRVLSPDAEVDA